MSLLQVVYFPDTPLTQKASPVETFDAKLEQLVADMLETMHHYQGVGLAAPQIGVSQRIFVLQEPEGPEMYMINPRIRDMEGREEGEEGCLSMPEVYAMVPRATDLVVEFQDAAGASHELEAKDFLARIIQHENDHLDGILFPERLDIFTRQEKLQEWEVIRQRIDAESEIT